MRGWYTETEHENKITTGYTITDDMTLYAFWEYTDGFVLVEGSRFTMGDTTGSGYYGETPTHSVYVSNFFMSPYEMTQKIYTEVMGTNPSSFSSNPASGEVQEERPVERVSWYDAIYFCNKYSEANGLTPCYKVNGSTDVTAWSYTPHNGNSISGTITCDFTADGYRLPTEAEWEYAAKGGKNKDSYLYSGSDTEGDVAWYGVNSGSKTHQVGLKAANSLGLYDMSGNVYEWCWDLYGGYTSVTQTNPAGPASGSYRVRRGGCWCSDVASERCASRGSNSPDYRNSYSGFRVVRSCSN